MSYLPSGMRMEPDTNEGRSSSARTRAQRCVDAAVANLLAYRGDVDACIDEALRHDPDCVGAYCVRASAALLAADQPRAADPRPFFALDRISDEADERERGHIRALRAWRDGDMLSAVEHYGRLLHDCPDDVLALHVAHALDFRLGERERLRDRIASVLPHWREDMPHFARVLAMYAFGLEENGDFAQAEAIARRSLELVPDNAAAIHVVAHVLEMQGRSDEGVAWLEATRQTWEGNRGFAVHVAWHLALFQVDRDDTAGALAIYDAALRPSASASTAMLVDASALLWRLELRGVDASARWRSLAAAWRRKPLRGMRAFNLVHAVIAFAAGQRRRRARRVIALLRTDKATRSANQPHDLDLAIPVCEALAAFAGGDYRFAVDRLTQVRAMAERCGGSVAQCDLILLTLLEAALRSHRARLAHALASERNARKPGSLLNRWLFARARTVLAAAWLPARSG